MLDWLNDDVTIKPKHWLLIVGVALYAIGSIMQIQDARELSNTQYPEFVLRQAVVDCQRSATNFSACDSLVKEWQKSRRR